MDDSSSSTKRPRMDLVLPGDLGRQIHDEWIKQYGEIKEVGIGPRIAFVFSTLENRCKEATIQKQIKRQAFAFCKTAIYTPQAYGHYTPQKQRFLRKSQNFNKTKPFNKNKYVRKPQHRKCRCYICGDSSHLANKCPKKNR